MHLAQEGGGDKIFKISLVKIFPSYQADSLRWP